jgi:hypothetical protein
MGASGFHGRVRNGVGWGTRAIGHQVDAPPLPPFGAGGLVGQVGAGMGPVGVLCPGWGVVVVADGGGGHSGD